LIVTALLALAIPKGFFPLQDTGLVVGFSVAPADASFRRMSTLQRAADEAIVSDPDVASVASSIGADGTNPTSNSGRVSIALKSRSDRTSEVGEVIRRLQRKLAEVPGITIYLQPVQDLSIETRTSRTQFQYTLEDADPAELAEWGPKVVQQLRTLPELRDVTSDAMSSGLKETLTIDRDTAAPLGILPQTIDDT